MLLRINQVRSWVILLSSQVCINKWMVCLWFPQTSLIYSLIRYNYLGTVPFVTQSLKGRFVVFPQQLFSCFQPLRGAKRLIKSYSENTTNEMSLRGDLTKSTKPNYFVLILNIFMSSFIVHLLMLMDVVILVSIIVERETVCKSYATSMIY